MTTKSDMLMIAAIAAKCASPRKDKAADCTRTIKVGDHIGWIDSDPDPLVHTAVPYCRFCWATVSFD